MDNKNLDTICVTRSVHQGFAVVNKNLANERFDLANKNWIRSTLLDLFTKGSPWPMKSSIWLTKIWLMKIVLLMGVVQANPALAKPRQLDKVEVVEKLDQIVLGDKFEFVDHQGQPVTLEQIAQDNTKVILLQFIYFTCPMICSFSLKGLVESLSKLSLSPVKDNFVVVSVSVDPKDSSRSAAQFAKKYADDLARSDFANQWVFLTSPRLLPSNSTGVALPSSPKSLAKSAGVLQTSVEKLAQKVGFCYYYDHKIKEFLHPTAITVITPLGKVSRYLYGISYDPFDLRLSILEAKKEMSLTTLEKALLYCYRYDPDKQSYRFFAMNFVRGGSLLVMVGLIFWIVGMIRFEVRREG